MEVTVKSDGFRIQDAAASGTAIGSGNLSAGFSLDVTSTNGFILGSLLKVMVSWDLSVPNVSYSFEDCSVQQEDKNVFIIKNSCFSQALGVGGLTKSGENLSYSYRLGCHRYGFLENNFSSIINFHCLFAENLFMKNMLKIRKWEVCNL